MDYCRHYFACWQHRGRKCTACDGVLFYIPYDVAPTVARCHVLNPPTSARSRAGK
jgi:hypothetical protein